MYETAPRNPSKPSDRMMYDSAPRNPSKPSDRMNYDSAPRNPSKPSDRMNYDSAPRNPSKPADGNPSFKPFDMFPGATDRGGPSSPKSPGNGNDPGVSPTSIIFDAEAPNADILRLGEHLETVNKELMDLRQSFQNLSAAHQELRRDHMVLRREHDALASGAPPPAAASEEDMSAPLGIGTASLGVMSASPILAQNSNSKTSNPASSPSASSAPSARSPQKVTTVSSLAAPLSPSLNARSQPPPVSSSPASPAKQLTMKSMTMSSMKSEFDETTDLFDVCQPLLRSGTNVKTKDRALKRAEFILYRNTASPHFWKGPGTPLSGAVRAQNEQLLTVLLEAKADVDEQDAKGVTSLHMATYEGHTDIMKVLFDFGAQVNLADGKGQTPLFFAPKAHICRLLATANADVSALNDKGQSALHLAAAAGIGDVMFWFVQTASRALLRLRDARGLTASDYAAKSTLRVDLLQQFQKAVDPQNTKNTAASIQREVAESSAAKARHAAATTIQRFVRGRITRRLLFGAFSAAGMAKINQFFTRSFIMDLFMRWRNATLQGAKMRTGPRTQ